MRRYKPVRSKVISRGWWGGESSGGWGEDTFLQGREPQRVTDITCLLKLSQPWGARRTTEVLAKRWYVLAGFPDLQGRQPRDKCSSNPESHPLKGQALEGFQVHHDLYNQKSCQQHWTDFPRHTRTQRPCWTSDFLAPGSLEGRERIQEDNKEKRAKICLDD